MAVRRIRDSWWVDIRFAHTRYRKRSPENSKAGAQAYEALLRQRLARGEHIGGNELADRETKLFEVFAREWFDEYVLSNNKYSEAKAKRYILSASLVPFFGKMRVAHVTTHHVEQYKAAQIKSGVSNKTINNRLTVLNKCLLTAHDWLEIDTQPPKIKKLRCPPPKTDYLTPEESEFLLSGADGTFREMLLTTLRTGVRQGELKALQWDAINWESGTLAIRHSWTEDIRALESPKNNRERIIPLVAEVRDLLLRRREHTGFVFADAAGLPFSDRHLNTRLAMLCAEVGLRRITWHVLRHTFATHLSTKGVALNAVQKLLGHATITTTMRYAHVPPSALREAVELLAPQH
jgi:integrase